MRLIRKVDPHIVERRVLCTHQIGVLLAVEGEVRHKIEVNVLYVVNTVPNL